MWSPTQNQAMYDVGFRHSPNFYSQSPPLHHYFRQSPTPQTQVPETQFNPSHARRISMSESEEEDQQGQADEVEEVEEIEVVSNKRGKQKVTARAKALPWTTEEVVALARTWIDISEDSAFGDDQDGVVFRTKIWERWCLRMGRKYRSAQSIYSKWRNASKVAKDFEAIYDQAERDWPSGATVTEVMASARELYFAKNGTANSLNASTEAFWNAIRHNEKWREQTSYHQFAINTKRSKTVPTPQSSNASTGFDMNVMPEFETLPMGRDQAKRKLKASGSGSTTNTTSSQSSVAITQLNEQITNLQTLQEKKETFAQDCDSRYLASIWY